VGNDGKPIYFDGIDNSAYVTGKSPSSARNSFIYIDGETLGAVRADIGGDPDNPDLKIAWKYLYTAKDTWLGPEQVLGGIGALYNLTMDPYEKYDMTFNGAMSYRLASSSPGKLLRPGQWLDPIVGLSAADRVRQIDHQIPEYSPRSRRSVERPAAQSARPVEPGAGDGSEQAATHRRQRRLSRNANGGRAHRALPSILSSQGRGRECPLWVISRRWSRRRRCPLYPRKRTCGSRPEMSAKCHEQTLGRGLGLMSRSGRQLHQRGPQFAPAARPQSGESGGLKLPNTPSSGRPGFRPRLRPRRQASL
jgi:hypothetical protein